MSEIKESGDNMSSQNHEASPGERLRIAREESGLSRDEVASHLKLSLEKIDSLERGEVDKLAAPVFVAGYLRAYAKLVGLPEEEIIADFKALSAMEAPSVDPSTSPAANNYGQMGSGLSGKRINTNGKDWGPMALWGSVFIVIAVALFIVFTGDKSETVDTLGKNTDKIEFSTIPTNEANEANDSNEETVVKKEDLLTENEPVPVTNQEIVAEQNNVKEVNEPPATASTQKINEGNLKHSVIVFNFKDDSWIEVNDALGKRLLYRTGKAGTSKTIWGVSPFKIQLGFVAGVEIIFNGEPYDLSRFANRRSARFTLGKTGDSMTLN